MKILFFLTVLANLIYFVWQYNEGAFQRADDAKVALAPKQIWLISEAEKQPSQNVAALYHPPTPVNISPNLPAKPNLAEKKSDLPFLTTRTALVNRSVATIAPVEDLPVPVIVETKVLRCYRVRLLADKAAVLRWARQQSLDKNALQLKVNRPVTDRYMVNYPAAATLEEAKKNVELLKTQGIDDFFMINSGKFKGAISLGVFKDKMKAIKAQQSYIQKGVPVQLSERHKTAATISAKIKTEKNKHELLTTLSALKPSIELLSHCE